MKNRFELCIFLFVIVNGTWGNWSSWGPCAGTCGNGSQISTYKINEIELFFIEIFEKDIVIVRGNIMVVIHVLVRVCNTPHVLLM
jgi:hypothetical protein